MSEKLDPSSKSTRSYKQNIVNPEFSCFWSMLKKCPSRLHDPTILSSFLESSLKTVSVHVKTFRKHLRNNCCNEEKTKIDESSPLVSYVLLIHFLLEIFEDRALISNNSYISTTKACVLIRLCCCFY